MLHDGGNHCDVELVELRSVPAPSFGDQGKMDNLLKHPDPDNDDLLSKSEHKGKDDGEFKQSLLEKRA